MFNKQKSRKKEQARTGHKSKLQKKKELNKMLDHEILEEIYDTLCAVES